MTTRWFTRYQPLSGSAQQYVDRHTGRTLSRQALEWTEARSVPLPHHQAVIVPYRAASPRLVARCFHLFIDHHAVVQAYFLPGRGTRRGRWCCAACQVVVRNKAALFRHVFSQHFGAVAVTHGLMPLTSCLGYIPSHARRMRMPWRVHAPELD